MLRRLLLFVSVVVFADTAFYAAVTPLLGELSREFSLSKGEAGLLAAAYPAGTLVAAIPGGLLAARAGVRPTVLTGLALMSVSSVAFAAAESVLVLDLARLVQGFGGAASWAGALAWLVGAAPRERRATLIGSALAAAIVGGLTGPVLGALAHEAGREAVFGAVGVIGVVLMAWALRLPAVAPEGADLRALRRSIGDGAMRAGMWLVTLPGLVFGSVAVLISLRLDSLGATATGIGAVFVAAAGLEAAVSPVVGRIADRRGRLVPLRFGVAASGVLVALIALPDTLWMIVVLMLVLSPALGVLWAPAIALLSDAAEHHGVAQGLAFALVNLAWAIGQTAGSAGGARLAEAVGDAVPLLALALVCGATLAALRFSGLREQGRSQAWP